MLVKDSQLTLTVNSLLNSKKDFTPITNTSGASRIEITLMWL